MASEFLAGALATFEARALAADSRQRPLGAPAGHGMDPLERARELTSELLALVACTAAQVRRLEAERDELVLELADALQSRSTEPPVEEEPGTAPEGELRAAFATALQRPVRHRPVLVAMMGGGQGP